LQGLNNLLYLDIRETQILDTSALKAALPHLQIIQ
jgi:hypothetical protein